MALKVYGVRIEEDVIKDFKNACATFPLALRPSAVIDSYMKSIIEASESYKKTGELQLEITVSGKTFFMLSSGENDYLSQDGNLVEITKEDY